MEGDTKMSCSHPGTHQNKTASKLPREEDGEQGGGGGRGVLKAGSGREAGRRQCRMSGTELLGTIQSYWELLSQKSLSVLMTSDRRKPRAGVYRRREAGRDSEPLSWDGPKEPGSPRGLSPSTLQPGAPQLGPRVTQSSQASTTGK